MQPNSYNFANRSIETAVIKRIGFSMPALVEALSKRFSLRSSRGYVGNRRFYYPKEF